MKKLFVSLVAAIVATTACFGQSSLLATLSHEGTISTFYGAGALRAAHAAAADGDIITLSSGSFVSTDITKGITLRGAGMEVNSEVHGEPTIISGDFSINIPEETTERLTIEGIYHNATIGVSKRLENATFLKNRFRIFASNQDETIKNATFIHCRISERLSLMADCSAACVNCIIMNPSTDSQSTSNFECVNCVLDKGSNWNNFHSSSLKNCILIATDEHAIPETCTIYNCLALSNGCSVPIFKNVPNTTNVALNLREVNQFFKSGNSTYNDNEKYELPEEAQSQYLGTNGTQVGIYGGTLPFSSTPTNPQITKCNVAAKSTADGKLSVDIEVSSVE